jgi:GNAT superfamily N-acetyltransferase
VSSVEIRPATREDVSRVYALMRGLAVYEKLEHAFVATEADLERALFGDDAPGGAPSARPVADALLATLDGAPIGYALYFTTYSSFLGKPGVWLEDLFVVPEARGQGAGLALLARLARVVVERGGGRLEWVVLDWNESAIGFYRGLGARPMDDWITYRLTGDELAALARKS